MSLPTYRSSEPLYVVTIKNNTEAEQRFKSWIRQHRIEHASVSGHRMMLHDRLSFEQFLLTWNHDCSDLVVWDTWQRRHIYLE